MDIYYLEETVDWNKPDGERYEYKRVEAKECEQRDFGFTEDAKKHFAAWPGFLLLCPDLDNDTLAVQGEPALVLS